MEQSGSELQDLREEVAETTKEIIKQVARRIELAKRIGQVKSRDSLPIDNEGVEDALLEEVLQECKELGLDQQLGTKILATLLAESKRAQRSQGSAKAQPLITPMVMMGKATEIEKKGKKLIRLDVGEPDFHPPKAVLDAVSEALRREGAKSVLAHAGVIDFECPAIIGGWSTALLAPISGGSVAIKSSGQTIEIKYQLRFVLVFWFSLAAGVVFALLSMTGDPFAVGLLAFSWLYFGNVAISLLRFNRFLSRTVANASPNTPLERTRDR